jgi:hypothetical protein
MDQEQANKVRLAPSVPSNALRASFRRWNLLLSVLVM